MASLAQRTGARIIDGIIAGIFSFVITLAFIGGAAFTADEVAGLSSFQRIAPVLVGIVFSVLYEGLLVSRTGATPGKMAVGLKVRNGDGSPVDLITAIKRYGIWGAVSLVGALVPAGVTTVYRWVPAVLIVAGIVMIAMDSRNQAPWDKIAGTIVVDD